MTAPTPQSRAVVHLRVYCDTDEAVDQALADLSTAAATLIGDGIRDYRLGLDDPASARPAARPPTPAELGRQLAERNNGGRP